MFDHTLPLPAVRTVYMSSFLFAIPWRKGAIFLTLESAEIATKTISLMFGSRMDTWKLQLTPHSLLILQYLCGEILSLQNINVMVEVYVGREI